MLKFRIDLTCTYKTDCADPQRDKEIKRVVNKNSMTTKWKDGGSGYYFPTCERDISFFTTMPISVKDSNAYRKALESTVLIKKNLKGIAKRVYFNYRVIDTRDKE